MMRPGDPFIALGLAFIMASILVPPFLIAAAGARCEVTQLPLPGAQCEEEDQWGRD